MATLYHYAIVKKNDVITAVHYLNDGKTQFEQFYKTLFELVEDFRESVGGFDDNPNYLEVSKTKTCIFTIPTPVPLELFDEFRVFCNCCFNTPKHKSSLLEAPTSNILYEYAVFGGFVGIKYTPRFAGTDYGNKRLINRISSTGYKISNPNYNGYVLTDVPDGEEDVFAYLMKQWNADFGNHVANEIELNEKKFFEEHRHLSLWRRFMNKISNIF